MLYNILDKHKYLVIIHDGETYTINQDNTSRYESVKEHLLKSEFDQVEKYLWTNMFEEYSDLVIIDNSLFYKGKKVPSTLADILFEKRKSNDNIKEYLKFFDSLEYNSDFNSNQIKKIKFYKSLSSIYPLGDVALYDSSEVVAIKGMKSLRSFNARFVGEVKRTKDIEGALEFVAGFKSKNLMKLFKKEIMELNNTSFVDFLILVKDLMDPNLIYSLWDKMKSGFSLQDPHHLNQFLTLNKKSDIGIFNYLSKNNIRELSELDNLLRRYPEVMIEVPELLDAKEMKESLLVYYRRKIDADYDLKQEVHFPEIKKCVLEIDDKLYLKFADNKDELAQWSQDMSNCIGGYARSARDGNCLLIGVFENMKIKYTIEVTPNRTLRQFVSYGNRSVPAEKRSKVIAHLKEHLIIKG